MSGQRERRLSPEQRVVADRLAGEAVARRLSVTELGEFVRSRCEGDDTVFREVVSLLANARAAHEGAFLEQPPGLEPEPIATRAAGEVVQADGERTADTTSTVGAVSAAATPIESRRPSHARRVPVLHGSMVESLSGYEVIREIHRGGQGVVYEAIQKSTKRKVAIKILKEGPFAGHQDKARFEREVEILGQLNHPNIVAIHDSGATTGAYYFVMDYIPGQPLHEWMSSRVRSIDEILRLFAKICEAVTAAHLRGVIHRDLKPANMQIDADDEPHILDFGLAKVTSTDWQTGERAQPMTLTGQFYGSLPWASPEQAKGQPAKIDVRTDVYSLGVILYQMLTGTFPYEVVGNIRDVLDRIMQAEPARPSTLHRRINNEVETIVLKCLSKERDRRYQSAGELARDIRHYLAGEPIDAKRDSALYVLRKLARRHAMATTALASVVVVILSFSTISLGFYRQSRLAREHQRNSDMLAADRAHELEAVSNSVSQSVQQMALGWFLLEWHADRLGRARSIKATMPGDSAEELAMAWLLGNDDSVSELEVQLADLDPQLLAFVKGERELKRGDTQAALMAFEDCIANEGTTWIAACAHARVDELRSGDARSNTRTPVDGESP